MTKWDKIISAKEVRRQQKKDNVKYWLWYAGMSVLVALSATSYWWIWIVLGLFIQSK